MLNSKEVNRFMGDKKLVFPGELISSAEEAEAGSNSYMDKDDIYSSAVGIVEKSEGVATVRSSAKRLAAPGPDMDVYCVVVKTSPNTAICECMLVKEAEDPKFRSTEFSGVLSAARIKRSFVPDLRSEVKIGDVIKARIERFEKGRAELTMSPEGYGLIKAFCPKCRSAMDIKEGVFICPSCAWKEYRKTPESKGGERSERRPGPRGFGGRGPGGRDRRRDNHGSPRFGSRERHR